jgi:hypothetical protein
LVTGNFEFEKADLKVYLCPAYSNCDSGPIVQGIEWKFPELQMQVRVLLGLLQLQDEKFILAQAGKSCRGYFNS